VKLESQNGRIRVEAGKSLRVFFDGREMAESSDLSRPLCEMKIWDNGVRITADPLRFPEGTLALDADGKRETQSLGPYVKTRLLLYAHGRMARVLRGIDGTARMVFGDSPKELLNATADSVQQRPVSPCIESWLRDFFIFGRAVKTPAGTPAAQRAVTLLRKKNTRFLRGEVGQFIQGTRQNLKGLWLAGVTNEPRVWTLHLEDVLDEGFYTLTLWRDGLPIDGEHFIGTEIEEVFEGVTRNDKPALEIAREGGFVARFEPCHKQEFRVLKSVEGNRRGCD